MFATSAALVALATLASGQNAIPAADVPFIGGGVFQRNDPYLANYTFVYRPPFDAKVYGDYYRWSVNNETVAIANLTGYDAQDGYYIPDGSYNMYPFFSVGEKHPRSIDPAPLLDPQRRPCQGPCRGPEVQEDPSRNLRERGVQLDHVRSVLAAARSPRQTTDQLPRRHPSFLAQLRCSSRG